MYGERCLSKSQVYEWHQRFKESRTSVSNDEHPGRPVFASDETVAFLEQKQKQQVLEDRHIATIESLFVHHWHQCWLSPRHLAQEIEDDGVCSPGTQSSPVRSKESTRRSLSRTSSTL